TVADPSKATQSGPDSAPRLRLANLRGANLHGLTLQLQRGEVVGVAGLTGSGRENLAGAVAGQTAVSGQVLVDGHPLKPGDPRNALARGVAYAPAARRRDALLGAASLRENV